MKIRFIHPAAARLEFQVGDELIVRRLRPDLERVLMATRLDGKKVARVVDEDETATVDAGQEEYATRRRRRAKSAADLA